MYGKRIVVVKTQNILDFICTYQPNPDTSPISFFYFVFFNSKCLAIISRQCWKQYHNRAQPRPLSHDHSLSAQTTDKNQSSITVVWESILTFFMKSLSIDVHHELRFPLAVGVTRRAHINSIVTPSFLRYLIFHSIEGYDRRRGERKKRFKRFEWLEWFESWVVVVETDHWQWRRLG